MKNKLYLIGLLIVLISCDKEEVDYTIVKNNNAQISFTTSLCSLTANPGCTGTLPPAMGATIKIYATPEEREQRFNEITTLYTDHEGKARTQLEAGSYYIYTLHLGREIHSEENAPVNSHSFHPIIIQGE